MDLNYLFHRHGQSLLMAQHAQCQQARAAHRGLAAGYAAEIAAALCLTRAVAA